MAPARSRRWRGMGLRRTGRRVADRLAAAAARRRRGSACLQSLVSRRLGCTRLGSRLADLCRTRALPAGRGRAMTCGGAMAASRMPARSPVRPRRHRCRMRSKTAERTGGRPNRGRRRLRFGTRRGRRRPLKPRRHQAEERERHGSDDRQLPDAHLSRTREPVTRRDSLAWRTALPALLRLPVEARVVARGLTDRRPFEWVLDRPTALVPKIIGTAGRSMTRVSPPAASPGLGEESKPNGTSSSCGPIQSRGNGTTLLWRESSGLTSPVRWPSDSNVLQVLTKPRHVGVLQAR